MENEKHIKVTFTGKKISRKEAIKKAGITALTATSILFLESKPASATSPEKLKPTTPGTSRPTR